MNNSYTYHFKDICNVQVTDNEIKQKLYTPTNINQRQVREFLEKQTILGFKGAWFLTFHYYSPSERVYKFRERKQDISKGIVERIGFKSKDQSSIWRQSGDTKLITMRNDPDQVSFDCKHLINVLLNLLFGIKRPHTYTGELPRILTFHEMGFEQYHTHLVIPECSICGSIVERRNFTQLYYLLNTKVRKKVKSLSKWKTIDVRPVNNQSGLYSYLNKQTNSTRTSFDPMSSIVGV